MKLSISTIPCCCLFLVLITDAIQLSQSWEFNAPSKKPKHREATVFRADDSKRGRVVIPLLPAVQTVAKNVATDAGVWTAAAFIGGRYLARQSGQVGSVARTIAKWLGRLTTFPGVAVTLCFLSIPLSQGRQFEGWSMFCKSFAVYLFRFLSLEDTAFEDTSFLPYALKGALGILTTIKMLHHIF